MATPRGVSEEFSPQRHEEHQEDRMKDSDKIMTNKIMKIGT